MTELVEKRVGDGCVSLEVDVATRDIQIAVLRREIDAQAAELRTANAMRRKSEVEVAALKEACSRFEGELEKGRGNLSAANEEIERLRRQLKVAHDEFAKLQGELKNAHDESAKLQGELKNAHDESAKLQGELKNAHDESAKLQGDLVAAQGEVELKKAELAFAQRESAEKTSALSAAMAHAEELRQEGAGHLKRGSDLQARLAAAQSECAAARESLERERKQAEQLRADCRKAEQAVLDRLELQERRRVGTYVRRAFAFFLPYGLVCWLKRKCLGIEEDKPLLHFPGFFKRIRRCVKFAAPYGAVRQFRRVFKR